MDRMVDRTCECLGNAEGDISRKADFRGCMGKDYQKLGEYDHSENEKEFTMKVRAQCPKVASDFRL